MLWNRIKRKTTIIVALPDNLAALAHEAKKDAWRPSGGGFVSLTAVVLGAPRDLRSPLTARAVDTNLFMVPCDRLIQQQTMRLRKGSAKRVREINNQIPIAASANSRNTIVRMKRIVRDRRRASRGERDCRLSVGPPRFCGK